MKENIEPKTQFIQEMRDFTDRMNERKNEMGGGNSFIVIALNKKSGETFYCKAGSKNMLIIALSNLMEDPEILEMIDMAKDISALKKKYEARNNNDKH